MFSNLVDAKISREVVAGFGDACWWKVTDVIKFETMLAVWGLLEEDFWSSYWGSVWKDPPHPALQDFCAKWAPKSTTRPQMNQS